jgi:hypothetical protein
LTSADKGRILAITTIITVIVIDTTTHAKYAEMTILV